MIYRTGYLLQRIGLVTILVQQAVSRVGGDQRASGVCMVDRADVGSGGVWGSFTEKENITNTANINYNSTFSESYS